MHDRFFDYYPNFVIENTAEKFKEGQSHHGCECQQSHRYGGDAWEENGSKDSLGYKVGSKPVWITQ